MRQQSVRADMAACTQPYREYVRLQRNEARILRLIAADCSPCSYLLISAASPVGVWRVLRRLRRRGLIEGHLSVGWRLTAAGWQIQRGE